MAGPTNNDFGVRGRRPPVAAHDDYRAELDPASLPGGTPDADRDAGDAELSDLFEHAPVGYLVLDDAGNIQRINRTGAAMLGWSPDWLLYKPFSRWVASRDKTLFRAHRRRLRHRRAGASQELAVKNRQGRYVNLRLESSRDVETGDMRTILIDVSGELQSARRARRLQSQLTHLSRLHTAGELASSLAHELNQPLGTVVLNCEAAMRLLQTDVMDKGECIEALSQATEAATFASDVIRHLRCFLKKNGELQQVSDLRSIVNDVMTLIDTDARDNDIDVQVDIGRVLPAVFVDPVQIEQVLVNLTHNSVEAICDAAIRGIRRVTIKARADGADRVRVCVSDTGPGLPGRLADRVFSPFYTTKTDGMGMGLSISRTIIESHGGTLNAEADTGDGARFCFTLPVARAARHAN